MKVRCINNNACLGWITVGKEYEVISQDNEFYKVLNDVEKIGGYCKSRFEVVEEQPQFDWEEFISSKTVVNCDTEDKAKNFLEECRSRGIVLAENKIGITRTSWDWYKEDTCYSFNFGGNNALTYSDKQFYESNDYKIIKWECENMKFKVGDWVIGTHINQLIYNKKYQISMYATYEFNGIKGYKLNGLDQIWFDDELKLYEEPKAEFTFQEVIGRIHPGEVYINTDNDARAEKISMEYSKNSLHIEGCFNNGFSIDLNHKFKLQAPKKQQVSIYEVEHKQEGKKYYFRSSVALNNGDFVVCDATQGKSYGRVVGGKMLELTESETNRYKECWRA